MFLSEENILRFWKKILTPDKIKKSPVFIGLFYKKTYADKRFSEKLFEYSGYGSDKNRFSNAFIGL